MTQQKQVDRIGIEEYLDTGKKKKERKQKKKIQAKEKNPPPQLYK